MPYPYESATPEQRAVGAWWWCVHHETHCEPLIEPVEARVAYIRSSKPAGEIETRLRELRPVLHPERLPVALVEARRAYVEARRTCGEAWPAYVETWRTCGEAWPAYVEAWRACDEARRAYVEAWRACEPDLMALHREEYPDTSWNGRTIFTETRVVNAALAAGRAAGLP